MEKCPSLQASEATFETIAPMRECASWDPCETLKDQNLHREPDVLSDKHLKLNQDYARHLTHLNKSSHSRSETQLPKLSNSDPEPNNVALNAKPNTSYIESSLFLRTAPRDTVRRTALPAYESGATLS